MQHGKRYKAAADQGRPTKSSSPSARPSTGSRRSRRPSSTRPSSSRCGSGSTPARRTRSSAGRSRCPRGPGTTVRVIVFAAGEAGDRGTRGGRRRGRRRRARGQDPRRVPRLRRRDRDAGPHGPGRDARPGPRAARAHAEPEDGHGHDRGRQGRRASSRRAASSTAPTRWATSTSASGKVSFDRGDLVRNVHAVIEELVAREAVVGQGPLPRVGDASSSTMGPGVKIDPLRARELDEAPADGLSRLRPARACAVGSHGSRPRSRAHDATTPKTSGAVRRSKGRRARLTRWLREVPLPRRTPSALDRAGTRRRTDEQRSGTARSRWSTPCARGSTSPTAAVVTEYRGLTVAEMAALRQALRAVGGDYKVFKNTLVRRAIEGSDHEPLTDLLEGPTAIAFVQRRRERGRQGAAGLRARARPALDREGRRARRRAARRQGARRARRPAEPRGAPRDVRGRPRRADAHHGRPPQGAAPEPRLRARRAARVQGRRARRPRPAPASREAARRGRSRTRRRRSAERGRSRGAAEAEADASRAEADAAEPEPAPRPSRGRRDRAGPRLTGGRDRAGRRRERRRGRGTDRGRAAE